MLTQISSPDCELVLGLFASGNEKPKWQWITSDDYIGSAALKGTCQSLNDLGDIDDRQAFEVAHAFGKITSGDYEGANVLTTYQSYGPDIERNSQIQYQKHYLVVTPSSFEQLDNNFRCLVGQLSFQQSARLGSSPTPIKRQQVNWNAQSVKERLTALREKFPDRSHVLMNLLQLAFLNRNVAVINFPEDENAKLDLLETLVLLLPKALRPHIAFATQGIPRTPNGCKFNFASPPNRSIHLDWNTGAVNPHNALASVPSNYAEEVVLLLYDKNIQETLRSLGSLDQAVEVIQKSGGPALVSQALDAINKAAGEISFGHPRCAESLYEAWKEATDLLDSWRVATGRADLVVLQRYLKGDGRSLDQLTWLRTMVTTFRQLAESSHDSTREGNKTLLIKQLTDGPEAFRSAFFDRESGFLGKLTSIRPYLAVIHEVRNTKGITPELRDEFLRGAIVAATTSEEIRKLLREVPELTDWETPAFQAILDNPGLLMLPGVKSILVGILKPDPKADMPTGITVEQAFQEMEDDEVFFYTLLKQALTYNRLNFFDARSLALIEQRIEQKKWQVLLKTFWPKLMDSAVLKHRQDDTDTWTVVARLALKPGCNDKNAMAQAVAVCLARQSPLSSDIGKGARAYAKHYKEKSISTQELFNIILKSPDLTSPPNSARLFHNLIDLIETLKDYPGTLTLLLQRTLELAPEIPVEQVKFGFFSRLMAVCAQASKYLPAIDHSWIPRAFRVAYDQQEDFSSLIDSLTEWATNLEEKQQGSSRELFAHLSKGNVLKPLERVKIFDQLMPKLKRLPLPNDVKNLMPEALAEAAHQWICEVASGHVQDPSDNTQLEYKDAEVAQSKIRDQPDPIATGLPEVDARTFCNSLHDFASVQPIRQLDALYGLLYMEKWLSDRSGLTDACGNLMRAWAEALPGKPLRYCLEKIRRNPPEDQSRKKLVCGLLEQYGKNIPNEEREKVGAAAMTAVKWAFSYLKKIQLDEVASLVRPIQENLDDSTRKIVFYYINTGSSSAPSGQDLIKSYEKELHLRSHQSDTKESLLRPDYVTGLLDFAVAQDKTAFLDASAVKWLADLLAYSRTHLKGYPELKDFSEACDRVLKSRVTPQALKQTSTEEKSKTGYLAATLQDREAWAKIRANLVNSGEGISDLFEGVPSDKELEHYFHALMLEMRSTVDVKRQIDFYRQLIKTNSRPEWSRLANNEVISLLAKSPFQLGYPLEALKELLSQIEGRDSAEVTSVKQKAYTLAINHLQAIQAMAPQGNGNPENAIRSQYLNWLVQKPDKDLLIGFAQGVSDPVIQVLAYNYLWKMYNPTESNQTNPSRRIRIAPLALRKNAKNALSKRHGTAEESTDASSSQPVGEGFETELITRWKEAADAACRLLEKPAPVETPFSHETHKQYNDAYQTVIENPKLQRITEGIYQLLLHHKWQEYFKSGTKDERYLYAIASFVETHRNKAASKARKGDSSFESHFQKALQAAKPQNEKFRELYAKLEGLGNQKSDVRKILDLLRPLRDKEAQEELHTIVCDLILTYSGLPDNYKVSESLDKTDNIAIRDRLRDLNKSDHFAEVIQKMKQDQETLERLIKITQDI